MSGVVFALLFIGYMVVNAAGVVFGRPGTSRSHQLAFRSGLAMLCLAPVTVIATGVVAVYALSGGSGGGVNAPVILWVALGVISVVGTAITAYNATRVLNRQPASPVA